MAYGKMRRLREEDIIKLIRIGLFAFLMFYMCVPKTEYLGSFYHSEDRYMFTPAEMMAISLNIFLGPTTYGLHQQNYIITLLILSILIGAGIFCIIKKKNGWLFLDLCVFGFVIAVYEIVSTMWGGNALNFIAIAVLSAELILIFIHPQNKTSGYSDDDKDLMYYRKQLDEGKISKEEFNKIKQKYLG